MKDVSKGKIIIEFIGLKSKMYYLIDVDGKENKKGKRVKSVVVENVKHKKYRNVFINKKIMRHTMKISQSEQHKLELMKSVKCI